MIQRILPMYEGVCNVNFNFQTYFNILLNKCLRLFVWEGLPETIKQRELEEQLLLCGRACFFKNNSFYYCLTGDWGGEPNVYYQPTDFIVSNPILGSRTLKVRQLNGKDSTDGLTGILMGCTETDLLNQGRTGGLYNLIYQTAGLLADNISSLNVAQINGRVGCLFTADSEEEALTGEKVLQDLYSGKPYKILSQNIIEKFGITPIAASGTNNTVMTLIEARRSILQDFYNEIGIGYQGNSKRERINTAEVGLMRGCLDCSITTMLKAREEAVEKINELFGLNISVEINPEIYYEGSGNATLGEDELTIDDGEDQIDGVQEDKIEIDEKNSAGSVEVEEEKGNSNTNLKTN